MAYTPIGRHLGQRGQPAAFFIFVAFEIEPNDAKVLHNLGRWLVDTREEPASASHRLTRTIAAGSRLAASALHMGMWSGCNNGRAENAYRALAIKSDYPDAQVNLGMLFARRGDWAAAADCFREALRLKPELVQVQKNLAIAERQSQTDRESRAKTGS